MDTSTLSLFDSLESDRSGNPQSAGLAIVPGNNSTLSKNQRAFNRLTRHIEDLQKTIRTETAKLEVILKVYLAELPALKRSVAHKQLALARALGGTTKTISYGKRQVEKVSEAIRALCDEAFSEIEPDEEAELFYDSWSTSSYQEELQGQRDLMKRMVAEEARRAFGVDIKAEDIDDSPEGFARFMNRLQNETMNGEGARSGRSAGRKKTKKQLEREEAREREEGLKLKSLRAIYLSLAKALHPDTITDPAEKARKEELMKKVTQAYAGKDLQALLKLEMEWVSAEQNSLESLPEEKLKLYIASLKEQVTALEEELALAYHHPRFACVVEFSRYPQALARQQIRRMARDFRKSGKDLDEVITAVERPAPKKDILRFVDEYISLMRFSRAVSADFIVDY